MTVGRSREGNESRSEEVEGEKRKEEKEGGLCKGRKEMKEDKVFKKEY